VSLMKIKVRFAEKQHNQTPVHTTTTHHIIILIQKSIFMQNTMSEYQMGNSFILEQVESVESVNIINSLMLMICFAELIAFVLLLVKQTILYCYTSTDHHHLSIHTPIAVGSYSKYAPSGGFSSTNQHYSKGGNRLVAALSQQTSTCLGVICLLHVFTNMVEYGWLLLINELDLHLVIGGIFRYYMVIDFIYAACEMSTIYVVLYNSFCGAIALKNIVNCYKSSVAPHRQVHNQQQQQKREEKLIQQAKAICVVCAIIGPFISRSLVYALWSNERIALLDQSSSFHTLWSPKFFAFLLFTGAPCTISLLVNYRILSQLFTAISTLLHRNLKNSFRNTIVSKIYHMWRVGITVLNFVWKQEFCYVSIREEVASPFGNGLNKKNTFVVSSDMEDNKDIEYEEEENLVVTASFSTVDWELATSTTSIFKASFIYFLLSLLIGFKNLIEFVTVSIITFDPTLDDKPDMIETVLNYTPVIARFTLCLFFLSFILLYFLPFNRLRGRKCSTAILSSNWVLCQISNDNFYPKRRNSLI
jgi:hypothetical protein